MIEGYKEITLPDRRKKQLPSGIVLLNVIYDNYYQFNVNNDKITDGMFTYYIKDSWYPYYKYLIDLKNNKAYKRT